MISNHKNYLDKHFQSFVYSILLSQHQFTQEILFTELDAYSFTLFCVKTDLWNTMLISEDQSFLFDKNLWIIEWYFSLFWITH